jgi:predicted Co/Zn/Cd cation transporter (cation efflux family)
LHQAVLVHVVFAISPIILDLATLTAFKVPLARCPSRMASSQREILLVAYSEKRNNVPAHWSMLITDEIGGEKSTKIHAIGSPFFGYEVETKGS